MKEHQAKVTELEKEIASLKLGEEKSKQVTTGLKDENVKLSEELKTLKEDAEKRERELKHQKMFDENKINAAQLKALNEGKDMYDVLSLSEAMNPEPKGTDKGDDTVKLSDEEKAIAEKLGHTDDDVKKYYNK